MANMKDVFDLQPTLIGDLIYLRPLQPYDFDPLYACASDPKIWEQHPQRNRYEKAVFRKFFDGALKSRGAFVVLDKATQKIIGSSRYYDLDLEKGAVTIGYTFLKTAYWGGKYNGELKKLMLDHAFRYVSQVKFEIGSENHRSRKAIEKVGALLLKSELLDEKPHVVYGISR